MRVDVAPAYLAATALVLTLLAPAAALAAGVEPSSSGAAMLQRIAGDARVWLDDAYSRAPALVLGLALVLALPPLMLLGLVLRHTPPRDREITWSLARRAPRDKTTRQEPETAAWPAEAWVEIDGRARMPIAKEMVRIGRDEDNEIRLPHKTVHRYHAVIHRNDDAEYYVQDLSSAEGNGVLVNGRRTAGAARLRNGDTLALGEAIVKFVARPV